MRLSTKAEMMEEYRAGRFGNTLRAWPSLDAYEADPTANGVELVLRYQGRPGRQYPHYGESIPPTMAREVAAEWVRLGARPELIHVNEGAKEQYLTIQGEVMRSERHIDLRYSTVRKPMRLALAEREEHTYGLRAVSLLRQYMDPQSFEELWELLDSYDDPAVSPVVEFSTWSIDQGTCTRRNTAFWEVRHY